MAHLMENGSMGRIVVARDAAHRRATNRRIPSRTISFVLGRNLALDFRVRPPILDTDGSFGRWNASD